MHAGGAALAAETWLRHHALASVDCHELVPFGCEERLSTISVEIAGVDRVLSEFLTDIIFCLIFFEWFNAVFKLIFIVLDKVNTIDLSLLVNGVVAIKR